MTYNVLNIDLSLDPQSLMVLIPMIMGFAGFLIFWFIHKSERIKHKFITKYGSDKGSAKFIMFSRYLGGSTIGLLPLVSYLIAFPDTSLSQIGLSFPSETFLATILWIIALSAIIIPLAIYNAKKPKNLVNYPQIRAREWSNKLIWGNLIAWAAYLLGYEMFFRGVLLFPLVESLGLWPAIAVNVVMYSATHIPKGMDEALGAIPLSIIFCLLTVFTATIWIAFIVHVIMAWTNSLTALKHNPDMQLVK